ncbi:hypothetical protein Kpol_1036p85 [Vanderwaltozyma polyspora DSM 70294]|uniref:Proline dehydrogenase n=1 Tax=Vanderwaltozyma polyspora (strain ATCC 22028 / DSM 70294 / BCRC 21397 / CBS 2163 / NBRC 10782 / NRRL Y-8283 / UCD 57-17) TaxID=436907 RepID=A7TEN1_VANPO|nr:uncharacterized protein Kpol_1036p85 [Vanderwaltozyma polyspora DSM 70294]EDO19338.1 hypothetical protein Kpol_1036p85 [Vanderwaltozyma polyspora DSM 70294]
MLAKYGFSKLGRLPKGSYVSWCRLGMISRGYVSQTNKTNTAVRSVEFLNDSLMPDDQHHHSSDSKNVHYKPPSTVEYLQTLTKPELLSLGCIGLVSSSKLTLDAAIMMFPYVPMPLIKIMVSSLYCGGSTMEEVRDCGKILQDRGISNMMLSLTIEDSEGTKDIDIDFIVNETIKSIHEILKPNILSQLEAAADVNSVVPGYIALKPSALVSNPSQVFLNFNNPDWKAQRDVLIDNCTKITQAVYDLNQELLKKYPQRVSPFFVSTIDAEKYNFQTKAVYELQRILFKKFNPVSSPIISCVGTWQLYLTDSGKQIDQEYKLAQEGNYRLGMKLVRGAYIHTEPNRDAVILPSKEATDINYNTIMSKVINDLLIKGSKSSYGHLVVASHNYDSQMLATDLLTQGGSNYGKANVTLAQLLGMADNVTYDLITHHNVKNIIKYVPWGPPLETKDYLLRRLQENGDAVRSDNGWPLVKAVFKTLFTRKKTA